MVRIDIFPFEIWLLFYARLNFSGVSQLGDFWEILTEVTSLARSVEYSYSQGFDPLCDAPPSAPEKSHLNLEAGNSGKLTQVTSIPDTTAPAIPETVPSSDVRHGTVSVPDVRTETVSFPAAASDASTSSLLEVIRNHEP